MGQPYGGHGPLGGPGARVWAEGPYGALVAWNAPALDTAVRDSIASGITCVDGHPAHRPALREHRRLRGGRQRHGRVPDHRQRGLDGNAPAALGVSADVKHTYVGDLKVDLVAPDGTLHNLHNRTGGSADDLVRTVTVNASSEVANGVWKLRVSDNAAADTGRIDSWALQF